MPSPSHRAQNSISLGILLLVLGLTLWLSPPMEYTSHGIYLPQTPEHYAPVNTVQISEHAPAGALEIGIIRTAIHFGSETPTALQSNNLQNMNQVLLLAKAQGANDVVGQAGMTAPGEMDAQIIYAKAYRLQTGEPL